MLSFFFQSTSLVVSLLQRKLTQLLKWKLALGGGGGDVGRRDRQRRMSEEKGVPTFPLFLLLPRSPSLSTTTATGPEVRRHSSIRRR